MVRILKEQVFLAFAWPLIAMILIFEFWVNADVIKLGQQQKQYVIETQFLICTDVRKSCRPSKLYIFS